MNINDIKLIGIHGPLDGGKDTTANHIQHLFPGHFGRYAFALPIKKACEVLFGFSNDQMYDTIIKERVDDFWGFTPRFAMQKLGTEFGRDMLRQDVWIKRAEMEHSKNMSQGKGTVIADVRFENEAEWLRSQPNSLIIYLKVPSLKKDERYQHASEAGIKTDSKDLLIINDKRLGMKHLFSQIEWAFEVSSDDGKTDLTGPY